MVASSGIAAAIAVTACVRRAAGFLQKCDSSRTSARGGVATVSATSVWAIS